MGRYVPRSGWAEQKTSRESCCGKTAIHHTCQPEFRRAKNCSFALRRLGQNREAKRVRRSLPVSTKNTPGMCGARTGPAHSSIVGDSEVIQLGIVRISPGNNRPLSAHRREGRLFPTRFSQVHQS